LRRIPSAYEFQTSAETIRAHHWRSYTDSFKGCEFECQFCLYKGPGEYGLHVRSVDDSIEARSDLGIVDIGTTTDPYQPAEADQKITRSVLESAAATGIPLFVLTRGDLVLRDVDVLRDLASAGMVEVCISIITLNEPVAASIEPNSPRPQERLRTAEQLVASGIPVAFHVAPLIPGLDTPEDLATMGRRLAEVSGSHVFSAMLGARKPFWAPFYRSMERVADLCGSFETFERAYPRDFDFGPGGAETCEFEYALDALPPLRDGVVEGGATYVSENYPYLTTGPLEHGIYRWKLPTAYDMASWIQSQGQPVDWPAFLAWYRLHQPSERLVELVHTLWDSGELFLGAYLAHWDGAYEASGELLLPAQRTLVAKRIPVV
jgi:DNA repair photolyase